MAMQTNLEVLIESAKHLSEEERKKLVEALHPGSVTPDVITLHQWLTNLAGIKALHKINYSDIHVRILLPRLTATS